MELKKIFLILSENEKSISYSSFLFETPIEKISFFTFLTFGIAYVLLLFSSLKGYALASAGLSILSLLFHSIASVAKDKEFFIHPIKSYLKQLSERIDSENEILQKLSLFSCEALSETKNIFENERNRIRNSVSFLSGSIDKVGLLPSFLAFFYAYHNYQSSPESGMLANVLLGLILGMYFGVLILQKIINWQNNSIYLLNKAEQLKSKQN